MTSLSLFSIVLESLGYFVRTPSTAVEEDTD